MSSHLLDYQYVAECAVRKCIEELLYFRQAHACVPCWQKPDTSYVTPADYAVQYHLYTSLSEAFPEVAFIGEESLLIHEYDKLPHIMRLASRLTPNATLDSIAAALQPTHTTSEIFWLVDPIDGTAGFIKNRFFAVTVSLFYEGKPVLSVIACPDDQGTSFKMYSAAKGQGVQLFTSLTSTTMPVQAGQSSTNKFCEASLAARNQQHFSTLQLSAALPGRPEAYRIDSQYKYALVAENAVDFFIRLPFSSTRSYSWDHAPGAFLVEEAGGIVSDISGAPLCYNPETLTLQNHSIILASGNRSIHEKVLQVLRHQIAYSDSQACKATTHEA